MKLALLSCVLVVMGASTVACSADEVESAPPPEPPATRLASSLERKLAMQIAIPADSPIGRSIDAMLEARLGLTPAAPAEPAEGEEAAEPTPPPTSGNGLVAREAVGTIGANGKKCTVVRFDDESGVEQMRRTKCEKTDELRVGKVTYTDRSGDGKIDELVDTTKARYEAFDVDHDGKVDRVVEYDARIAAPPPSLSDFGEEVSITNGGKIESRAREDRDHDGKFDVESVTATTSFQVRAR